MKSATESNADKVPLVIIDPELNKLKEAVLFPDKVEKAKHAITRLGLPKVIADTHSKAKNS